MKKKPSLKYLFENNFINLNEMTEETEARVVQKLQELSAKDIQKCDKLIAILKEAEDLLESFERYLHTYITVIHKIQQDTGKIARMILKRARDRGEDFGSGDAWNPETMSSGNVSVANLPNLIDQIDEEELDKLLRAGIGNSATDEFYKKVNMDGKLELFLTKLSLAFMKKVAQFAKEFSTVHDSTKEFVQLFNTNTSTTREILQVVANFEHDMNLLSQQLINGLKAEKGRMDDAIAQQSLGFRGAALQAFQAFPNAKAEAVEEAKQKLEHGQAHFGVGINMLEVSKHTKQYSENKPITENAVSVLAWNVPEKSMFHLAFKYMEGLMGSIVDSEDDQGNVSYKKFSGGQEHLPDDMDFIAIEQQLSGLIQQLIEELQ